jgi:hypothetical protein
MKQADRQTAAGRLQPIQRKKSAIHTATGWAVFMVAYWAEIVAVLYLINS